MNKRLMKRHKRHVLRAKQSTSVSEPDVRTPEQVQAARDASRAVNGKHNILSAPYAALPQRPAIARALDADPKLET